MTCRIVLAKSRTTAALFLHAFAVKRPSGFSQDGRFFPQPLLFVVTATNNCPAIGVAAVAGVARLFALLSTAFSPQNSRKPSTKTAVFLSYQPRCQRRQPLTTFPSVRSPAFLFCRPRPSARETTVSLQPRRPFFFLSRKKEKVGGKKKESFAYGKRRNAVRCLRRGKRRFILPTGTASLNS